MKRERRQFDKEFKLMAVNLCHTEKSTKEVADDLDVRLDVVHRWRRELEQHGEGSFSGHGNMNLTAEQKETLHLKRELREAQIERDNLKKGSKHLLQERQQKFQFIKDPKKAFAVEKMCKVFNVSRGGYYHWASRKPSNHSIETDIIKKEIKSIYQGSKGRYGSPKITMELKSKGIKASRPRVARIMRSEGLKSIIKKKHRVCTTNSGHNYPVSKNILNRNFRTQKKGQAWVSDITYIHTNQGWLYLTIIMDLYDRKIVGWALSDNMTTKDTIVAAWRMAVINRPISSPLIFHSDRGVQYASKEFRILLAGKTVIQSMSRKGNCWDNAVVENFFKILKSELIFHRHYLNFWYAKNEIFEFIEVWYNKKRRHSYLGYLTPDEFGKSQLKNVA
ncbi:IS3 family transposase [Bacteroidales bacterium]|nr:IS3 family transposase [Bacteroidales bacterium]